MNSAMPPFFFKKDCRAKFAHL